MIADKERGQNVLGLPQVSIVVPVYNVEGYIPRCLDSILAQTLKEWECICVDDGSTDGSGAVLDEYAAKDSRFVVIHKENGGVSAARNAGIDAARAEFIGFCDPDDWTEPETYQIALDVARRTGADIVQWGGVTYRKGGATPYRALKMPEGAFDMVNAQGYWDGGVTCKLFRRAFLAKNNIRFCAGVSVKEDAIFALLAYALTQKCFFICWPLYHHDCTRKTSLTHNVTSEMRRRSLYALIETCAFIDDALSKKGDGARAASISRFLVWEKAVAKMSFLVDFPQPDFELFRSTFPETTKANVYLRLLFRRKTPVFAIPMLAAMRLDAPARALIRLRKRLKGV